MTHKRIFIPQSGTPEVVTSNEKFDAIEGDKEYHMISPIMYILFKLDHPLNETLLTFGAHIPGGVLLVAEGDDGYLDIDVELADLSNGKLKEIFLNDQKKRQGYVSEWKEEGATVIRITW